MKRPLFIGALILSLMASTHPAQAAHHTAKQWAAYPAGVAYLFARHGFCLTLEERAMFYFDYTAWWNPEQAG